MPASAYENPISAAELTAELTPDGLYLAAIGSYSPDPNRVNKYILYRENGDRIEGITYGWLTIEEAAKLEKISNLRIGESDSMYALSAVVVWYRHGDTMKIFDDDKLIFSLVGDQVALHGNPLNRADIQNVHAYLDRGWVECGVRLVLPKEEMLIACQVNEIASMDITYDGFNLLVDTWWAVAMGRLLSEALGVPYVADEDLR